MNQRVVFDCRGQLDKIRYYLRGFPRYCLNSKACPAANDSKDAEQGMYKLYQF